MATGGENQHAAINICTYFGIACFFSFKSCSLADCGIIHTAAVTREGRAGITKTMLRTANKQLTNTTAVGAVTKQRLFLPMEPGMHFKLKKSSTHCVKCLSVFQLCGSPV